MLQKIMQMAVCGFLSGFGAMAMAKEVDAEAVLAKAETIRNPERDYRADVVLVDEKKGKREVRTYETLVKGRDKAFVRFLTPATDKGTKLLLVAADMWIYIPSTAKPVRISPRQKLTGNAAYGDIARLNFDGNYKPAYLRSDRAGKRKAHVLDLEAIEGRPVTYDRIEYWVDAESFRPIKAIYKTAAGKALREATFGKFKKVMGAMRPTEMVLVNHLQKQHVTTLTFKDSEAADLPDILFQRQNLSRD